MMDNLICPYCGSIKVIERPALFSSSIEVEMLSSEPEDTEYNTYRCLVCGREFNGKE